MFQFVSKYALQPKVMHIYWINGWSADWLNMRSISGCCVFINAPIFYLTSISVIHSHSMHSFHNKSH